MYKWEVEKWDDMCGQLFQDVGPIEEEKKLKTEERDEIKTDSSESRKGRMQVKGRGALERRRNSFIE